MTNITGNLLFSMNQGDYFSYPLFINVGDMSEPIRYKLKKGDQVFVSLMSPGQLFEDGVVRKVLTKADLNKKGDPMVKLLSEDTENVLPGLYYLEIRIKLRNGNVSTIMPKKKFYIYE